MKEKELARDYKSIREDFRFDADIFSTEDERSARLKWVLDNRLLEPERILLLLYIEAQSYRKLADRMGVAHQTIARNISRIRKKVIEEYNKIKDNENLY